jgi:hypothetical protein
VSAFFHTQINSLQSWRLHLERRPARLPADEEEVPALEWIVVIDASWNEDLC